MTSSQSDDQTRRLLDFILAASPWRVEPPIPVGERREVSLLVEIEGAPMVGLLSVRDISPGQPRLHRGPHIGLIYREGRHHIGLRDDIRAITWRLDRWYPHHLIWLTGKDDEELAVWHTPGM